MPACAIGLHYNKHNLTCAHCQDTAMTYILLIFISVKSFKNVHQALDTTDYEKYFQKEKKRDSYHRDIYFFLFAQSFTWTSSISPGCHERLPISINSSVCWTRLLSEVFIIVTFYNQSRLDAFCFANQSRSTIGKKAGLSLLTPTRSCDVASCFAALHSADNTLPDNILRISFLSSAFYA